MDCIRMQVESLRKFGEIYNIADYEITMKMMNEAADTIESLYKNQSDNKWIPCSERLPTMEECQKDDCRFILDDGNKRYQGTFDYTKQYFTKFNLWYGIIEDKCVIAWQPLPESYCKKEDSTESDIPKNKSLSREETDKMQNLLNGNAFLNSVDFSKRHACNCLGDKI